jgi:hypothetical protein
MGKHEKIAVSDKPPAPTARAVLEHRKKLEIERDAMRDGAAELALRSAQGDTAAQAALWAIPAKQAGLQFEIDQNHAAYALAAKQDGDAETAWRAQVQSMAPEDLIAGINKDECCHLCQPGSFCVITAGYLFAGATCGHPIRQLSQIFGRDANGVRQFLYNQSPRALAVFNAGCERLKVPKAPT